MSIIFFRSVILYLTVIFAVRLMGKRQLGELQPSELVITILISNIATLPLEDTEIPLTMGLFPILTLVCYEVIMSWITLKSRKIRKMVSGQPKIIISNGKINQNMLKELRLSLDDLMAGLRNSGIFDITEVQYAIVETNGSISVLEKTNFQNATKADVGKPDAPCNPPQIYISDGHIIHENLGEKGKNKIWLNSVLEGNKISADEIFFLSADGKGKVSIVKKERN